MDEPSQKELPRIDAYEDTEIAKSLEKIASDLALAETDPYNWKWVIIALHNAIQATIVRAIAGGDGSGAFTKEAREHNRKLFMAELAGEKLKRDWPWERLADFLELYNRVKIRRRHVERPTELDDDMETLNYIRNEFIHYKPSRIWTVALAGWPKRVLRCLDFIEALMPGRPTGGAQWLFPDRDGALAERSLRLARERALALNAQYNDRGPETTTDEA